MSAATVDGGRALGMSWSAPERARLRAAWRFHLAHAGYATPPGRAASALSLARAELAADALGWQCYSEPDNESAWEEGAPRWSLTLCDSTGVTLDRIGSIDVDPDPALNPYGRVLAAELAEEQNAVGRWDDAAVALDRAAKTLVGAADWLSPGCGSPHSDAHLEILDAASELTASADALRGEITSTIGGKR